MKLKTACNVHKEVFCKLHGYKNSLDANLATCASNSCLADG